MTHLATQARAAVNNLLLYQEDELYLELGKRLDLMRRNPSIASSFDPEISSKLEFLGAMDDVRKFGRRFFDRINAQAYGLVCGDEAEDSEERRDLLGAFRINRESVAAALAALLVAHLGLAPAIASVVSAISIRLFFEPAYEAMCDVWRGKLS